MSVIPFRDSITLYQGSTFDETWTAYEDEAETDPTDWSGHSAAMKVRKEYDGPALIELDTSAFTPGPATKGIILGGAAGTIRAYIGSTILAGLDESSFEAEEQEDGSIQYKGVFDLEVENAGGERFRQIMGTVTFSREVTY